MKLFFASSSSVAIPIIVDLLQDFEISGAITSPDKPRGRGQQNAENDFAEFCSQRAIPVYKPKTGIELNQILTRDKPDLVITVAYGRLIKKSELEVPKFGWLNVHFSLLPRWRGAAPVQYAIWNGDLETGVTVFKLDEGMDTGDIYAKSRHKLNGGETSKALLESLARESAAPLRQALNMIRESNPPTPQTNDGVTLAPKISKADGEIDWHSSAIEIERKVRAFIPWPGTWTTFRGTKISLNEVSINQELLELPINSGEIQTVNKVIVGTGNGSIELIKVKPEGKREMTALDWIRGIQDKSELQFK